MGAGLSTSGAKWDGQRLSGSGAKFARGLGCLFLSRFRFPGPAASVASTPVCSFVCSGLVVSVVFVCLFVRSRLFVSVVFVCLLVGLS
jgi:hypothetical protein